MNTALKATGNTS